MALIKAERCEHAMQCKILLELRTVCMGLGYLGSSPKAITKAAHRLHGLVQECIGEVRALDVSVREVTPAAARQDIRTGPSRHSHARLSARNGGGGEGGTLARTCCARFRK